MTTTSTFQGLEPEARNSSRVLRPPGGGSSFSFGVENSQQQPARRYKMASNIFGVPDDEPPVPMSRASEPEPAESAACGDDPHRTCAQAEYSDAAEHTGEAEVPETEPAREASGEPAQPAPPAAVPSRRNPPGGKSSLVLG